MGYILQWSSELKIYFIYCSGFCTIRPTIIEEVGPRLFLGSKGTLVFFRARICGGTFCTPRLYPHVFLKETV